MVSQEKQKPKMNNNFIYKALSDDKGVPSAKRIIATLMALTAIFVIIHTEIAYATKDFNWSSVAMLLGVIFGFISALVAVAAFERKNILNSQKEEDKAAT